MGILLGLGTLNLISVLQVPIFISIIGIAIAAAFAPIVHWLQQWMGRAWAIVLVYFVLSLFFGVLVALILPTVIQQAQDFVSSLPEFVEQIQATLQNFNVQVDLTVSEAVTSLLSNFGVSLFAFPISIVTAVGEIILIIFISLYGLVAAPELQQFVKSLFPTGQRSKVEDVLEGMAHEMGGFIRGTVIDGFIVGVLTYIGLIVIGVEFSAVLAVLAGLLEFLPIIGPIIVTVIVVAVALLESTTQALIALVFLIILQQFESHILVPNIMHSQADISPVLSILALVVGGTLGGLLGALAAIPLAAALRVFVIRVVAPAIRARTGAPEPDEEEED